MVCIGHLHGRLVVIAWTPRDRPKKLVSLRLDPDVIEHFRERGPGWQSAINAELRRSMLTTTSKEEER